MVKEPGEIERIQAAARVADQGMRAAASALRPGISESLVAAEAEYAMRQAGAEGFWRSYVCSGPRTNIAHGLPTTRIIQPGDLVMIDIHPIVDGYSADVCRTFCVGEPTSEQRAAYDIYLQAQQSTIGLLHAGVGMDDLEAHMHSVLAEAGHGEHIFGPPIHGVGIEFEEAPSATTSPGSSRTTTGGSTQSTRKPAISVSRRGPRTSRTPMRCACCTPT